MVRNMFQHLNDTDEFYILLNSRLAGLNNTLIHVSLAKLFIYNLTNYDKKKFERVLIYLLLY